jgi:uncharacterized membrane protein YvbJ
MESENYRRTFCPQCGWDQPVDEDGLCVHCGVLACGDAVDKMSQELDEIFDSLSILCGCEDSPLKAR